MTIRRSRFPSERIRPPKRAAKGGSPWSLGSLVSLAGIAFALIGGGMIWYYLRLVGHPGLTQASLVSGPGITSLVVASILVYGALVLWLVMPALVYRAVLSYFEAFGAAVASWPLPGLTVQALCYGAVGMWAAVILYLSSVSPVSTELYVVLAGVFGLLVMRLALERNAEPQVTSINWPAAVMSFCFGAAATIYSIVLALAMHLTHGGRESDTYILFVGAVVLLATSYSNGLVGSMLSASIKARQPTDTRKIAVLVSASLLFMLIALVILAPTGRFIFAVFETVGVRYGPIDLVVRKAEASKEMFAGWKSSVGMLGDGHVHLGKVYVAFDFGGQRLVCDSQLGESRPSGPVSHCLAFKSEATILMR